MDYWGFCFDVGGKGFCFYGVEGVKKCVWFELGFVICGESYGLLSVNI